jgi:hypothetical protein
LIFDEREKSTSRFLPSDFVSETVFLVLTACCEISFLALEKIEKHRELNIEKCMRFKFFPKTQNFSAVYCTALRSIDESSPTKKQNEPTRSMRVLNKSGEGG